jgi:hypothetical protein
VLRKQEVLGTKQIWNGHNKHEHSKQIEMATINMNIATTNMNIASKIWNGQNKHEHSKQNLAWPKQT